MNKTNILWVDDEIDLLKPHIMFLNTKGYDVATSNNGNEALEILQSQNFDIIFLDEHMPGLSGIETLALIKEKYPNLPVVMITKSEEEDIMEDAIGSNISDYLIKPVNPKQILLCLKKNLDNKKLISEKSSHQYQQEFRNIGMEISGQLDYKGWVEVYKKICLWDLRLEKSGDEGMKEILQMQKDDANQQFSKFVEKRYLQWLQEPLGKRPVMSHTLFRESVFPYIESKKPTFFLLIDNLRFDQWKILQPKINEYFRVEKESLFYSILPTVTQYSRNAIFSGLMPSEIKKRHPQYWVTEEEDKGKNLYEHELLQEQFKRFGKNMKTTYTKVLNVEVGRKLVDNLPNLINNPFNVIVYNFIDMLSHKRTEMEVIKELASDEAAYRSLTLSWFEHSPLLDIIKYLSTKNANLIITTDHGSIRVDNPVKVVGDRNTNTNLRYKTGRNLGFTRKDVYNIQNPDMAFLPKTNISSTYIFAKSNDFLAYPNNYNYYVNYYDDTFQHGGISMEEVLIPFIVLKGR